MYAKRPRVSQMLPRRVLMTGHMSNAAHVQRTCIICVTVSMHMNTSASVSPRTLRASLMYWSSLSICEHRF